MRLYLKDSEGSIVAFKDVSEEAWTDPHGGLFSAKDQRDMNALAAGEIDRWQFGADLRLTVKRV